MAAEARRKRRRRGKTHAAVGPLASHECPHMARAQVMIEGGPLAGAVTVSAPDAELG